jgi:hypothetical protein
VVGQAAPLDYQQRHEWLRSQRPKLLAELRADRDDPLNRWLLGLYDREVLRRLDGRHDRAARRRGLVEALRQRGLASEGLKSDTQLTTGPPEDQDNRLDVALQHLDLSAFLVR